MFKFITFVLVIGFILFFFSGNLLAAEANDAEIHYFRGIEYYMYKQYYNATLEFGKAIKLKPDYTEAQSAFKVAYAKLKEDDSEENIAPQHEKEKTFSPVYGCLGAYRGAIFGFTVGVIAGSTVNEKPARPIIIGFAILGAVTGGYSGSQADTLEEKRDVIGHATLATILVGLAGVGLYLLVVAASIPQ